MSTIRMTPSTATGRRFQLFSPVPAMNGMTKSRPMAMGGPSSMSTVSVYGGRSAKRENSARK